MENRNWMLWYNQWLGTWKSLWFHQGRERQTKHSLGLVLRQLCTLRSLLTGMLEH